MTAPKVPTLLELAESVKVVHVDADLYVALFVPGRGFCSAKIVTEFNPLAAEWERLRVAAIAHATIDDLVTNHPREETVS